MLYKDSLESCDEQMGHISEWEAIMQPSSWGERIAYWISQIGSPPAMGVLTLALIAVIWAHPRVWIWGGLYLALGVALPLLYIVAQVRLGNITDVDIHLREQRSKPFIVMMVGLTLTWIAMRVGQAPLIMLTLVSVSLLQMLPIFLITYRWKISVHAATAAAVSVMWMHILGRGAFPLLLVTPAVAWSRIKLRRHTPAQTLAGILLGSGVVLFTLWLVAQG